MYLITYKETGDHEAIISKYEDFDAWLKEHNEQRENDGELPEEAHEFSIDFIELFTPNK